MFRALFILLLLQNALSGAHDIEGRVVAVDAKAKVFELAVSKSNTAGIAVGSKARFRVSAGDAEIGYEGRTISANANFYNKAWHLEQVFPLDGEGAKKVNLANRIFLRETEAMGRGKFLKEGQKMPYFGPDQPVALNLIEIEPGMDALKGVAMELDDCAFPLLTEIVQTSDLSVGFYRRRLGPPRWFRAA